MSIQVQCPGCGRRFQAGDQLAGKRAKCPQCSAAIAVPAASAPASSAAVKSPPQTARPMPQTPASQRAPAGAVSGGEEAAWYVQTSDGHEHGPMNESQLRRLVADGRLDCFSRLRHQSWPEWKWAEDIFPQLAEMGGPVPHGGAPSAAAAPRAAVVPRTAASQTPKPGPPQEPAAPEARMVACPDCGGMVSARAKECPHCGCPALGPVEEAAAVGRLPRPSSSRRRVLAIVGSAAGVLLVVAVGLGIGWWLGGRHHRLEQPKIEAPAVVQAVPATPAVPPDQIEAALKQAAAETARRLDDQFRAAQAAKALLEQTQASVELIKGLAEVGLDAIPDTLPAEPAPGIAPSYPSLYDGLYDECLGYLRQNVSQSQFTPQSVWDAARRWEEGKRAGLEKELTETLQKHLAPGRPPG